MATIESNAASSIGLASTTKTKSGEDFDSFVGTREDFLTILLAQLKFQDPLDPMEGTEFIDSITRLSSVEQSINQNAHLESIESLLKAERDNFGSPVSYLDKEIEFNTPIVSLKDGRAEFSYDIPERPDDVFIVIQDTLGNVVRRANGEKVSGKNTIVWDGLDNAGNPLSDGEYFVTVDYAIGEGEDAKITSVDTVTKGIVTGANFESDDVVLLVGNIKTSVGDIISIRSQNN
ncbi:MAG: flagellar hook assembly protein FlgD [Rickettsiales bacterium]|nr:flagellar hook assembly protein FlgD [Pseudomonadota bacterium]MDA0965760.1 flagellar hook assembly protein FlgD [Pseudomonadota bacterium]MDG4543778.1 flagellar hook assembly protein FlgD [Rickettsiales bacterium]MDG4545925.1 flagellar hook assembly protein FlgD [Rickettsiales bacterium]MDG4548171.1 flagellar hook assembly protein FlgD [Rickettsiales bacterium]